MQALPNKRYGGPWQEFRAFVATILLGLALKIHSEVTFDSAEALTELRHSFEGANDGT